MPFDPENKIVQLCAKGMNAEAAGRTEEARLLFQEAWDGSTNDFEAFTAAHFLARQQEDPGETLRWNLESLRRAEKISEEDMQSHFPSLYLNVAKSYEVLDKMKDAQHYYGLAADQAVHLPAGKYAEMIKMGIQGGLLRTKSMDPNQAILKKMIEDWCDQKNLKPLAILLPAYLGNLGSQEDLNKLVSALHYLSATHCLPEDEQGRLEELIASYNQQSNP
jgi:hypothetical protein